MDLNKIASEMLELQKDLNKYKNTEKQIHKYIAFLQKENKRDLQKIDKSDNNLLKQSYQLTIISNNEMIRILKCIINGNLGE